MKEYTFDQLEIGQTATFSRRITVEMENAFREISGDENPLHCDDDFAQNASDGKFSRHVAFGMLTASMYSTMAGMHLPGKYSLIHSLDNISFQQPVFAGDELTVTGKVVDKDENLHLLRLKVVIKNQAQKVVSKAVMKVVVLR